MAITSFPDSLEIKTYKTEKLQLLAADIRKFLIESISQTGGHIGANLSVIELTIALHYCFDISEDKLLFDTGHQGYTHKLLTGRKDLFTTLNSPEGMSRFISRQESDYDILDASHAGTAISTASGIALAQARQNKSAYCIAIVGDGAFTEGESLEGLNYIIESDAPPIIVINDNGMAIAPNLGAIHQMFSSENWIEHCQSWFSNLGFNYFSVENGHDIESLICIFEKAKRINRNQPVVIHIKTEKGKGLEIAKNHKYKMHFSLPFNAQTGQGSAPTTQGKTFARIAGDKLYECIKNDPDIHAITPATPYASELDNIFESFPHQITDCGMAEQHALSMAAGLAIQGLKSVVCIQSTFLQRALDQIIHDIAFPQLNVTLLVVRSGFAGYDGPTHHGIYDLAFLQGIPHLKIFYAGTEYDLQNIIETRLTQPSQPMAILYPYEIATELPGYKANPDLNCIDIIEPGKDICLLTLANCLPTAIEVREKLLNNGIDIGIINIRWIKPLKTEQILKAVSKCHTVVSLEEHVSTNGIGVTLSALFSDNNINVRFVRFAISDSFVPAGDKPDLQMRTGIDSNSITQKILQELE